MKRDNGSASRLPKWGRYISKKKKNDPLLFHESWSSLKFFSERHISNALVLLALSCYLVTLCLCVFTSVDLKKSSNDFFCSALSVLIAKVLLYQTKERK